MTTIANLTRPSLNAAQLALVALVNCLLAAGALTVAFSAAPADQQLAGRLKQAIGAYNFSDPAPASSPPMENAPGDGPRALPVAATTSQAGNRSERAADQPGPAGAQRAQPAPPNGTESTQLWDKLQARGCCGFANYTDWSTLPKSCCAHPVSAKPGEPDKWSCKEVDGGHEQPCEEFITNQQRHLPALLVILLLVQAYMAIVSGLNTYRLFHYNEANQNAYS